MQCSPQIPLVEPPGLNSPTHALGKNDPWDGWVKTDFGMVESGREFFFVTNGQSQPMLSEQDK